MLQELLNAGLVDIGGDDSRFAKMQSAASALTARFKQEPSLLIPATLIALDSGADEMDLMFRLVEELVISEWKTLRNTHVNRPRELLRSIIIEALASATKGRSEVAAVIWQTAAGPVRHRQVRLGKAGPLVEKFLKEASRTAEAEAVGRAALAPPSATKRNEKRGPIENDRVVVASEIQDDELVQDVARAVGPLYQGQGLDAANPHWSNAGQPWSNELTPRMTAALVKAVNLGTARLAESLDTGLSAYTGALEDHLNEQLREVERLQTEMSRFQAASRMRLDVLWWSEALYSPALQEGYGDLALPIATVAAATDLVELVPALAPASVSYVLGEVVMRVARMQKAEGKQPILSYLDAIATAKPDFGPGFRKTMTNDVRLRLVDLVGEATAGRRVSTEVIRTRAGIEEGLTLSAGDFARWVFGDLQAQRLVEVLQ